ncbi:MAG TPA: CPBP family intramembrane metalloprotease [Chromatiaceae bacterium]|nr:CPBP family intramembrane metalloprotease [Chromatiaceae bacterium]
MIMWVLYLNQNIAFPESFSYLEELFRAMEKNGEALMETLIIMDSPFDLAVNMFMIALVPALGEELLFRGTLQKVLNNVWQDPHVAILVSGCIFSCFHLQFYGFFPRFILGVIFGYMFWWSGKIRLPIFAHFIHNGVQVALIYLNDHGFIATDIETVEKVPWYTVVIGTILLSFSLRK